MPDPTTTTGAMPRYKIMRCPECSAQHVDEGEWAKVLHHKHLCMECGHVWRVEPHTFGVATDDPRTTAELVPNRIWSVAGIPRRRIVYLRGDHNEFMSNSVRYWDLVRRIACDCSQKAFRAWARKTGALTHDL